METKFDAHRITADDLVEELDSGDYSVRSRSAVIAVALWEGVRWELTTDQSHYQPGEEGRLSLRMDGEPWDGSRADVEWSSGEGLRANSADGSGSEVASRRELPSFTVLTDPPPMSWIRVSLTLHGEQRTLDLPIALGRRGG